MEHGEAPSPVLELVDRVAADLGDDVVDDAAVVLRDDLLDHVLEETEHRVRCDVDRLDHLGRLDHRGRVRIEAEDRRRGLGHLEGLRRDASTASRASALVHRIRTIEPEAGGA
jgi:hypothetical protein